MHVNFVKTVYHVDVNDYSGHVSGLFLYHTYMSTKNYLEVRSVQLPFIIIKKSYKAAYFSRNVA